jgi:FtsP/CotA-like multicopper oxidase with cupredoxin domain
MIGVIALLVLVTGVIQTSPPSGSPGYALGVSVSRSSCVRPPGFFLVIADLSGFNDSIAHGAPLNPWPVVHVHLGDYVRFLVCNTDQTQAHGFAIQTYFDTGVVLAPGDAFRIEFQATIPGSFVIYCQIFCTVHAFMVGRLIVSNS